MKQIFPDLWQTEIEHPAPGLYTHAYLLTRDSGNVLFYNTSHRREVEKMAKLGGVSYQYLSHQDELGESLSLIRERFGAKLGGHVNEQDEFSRFCKPDILFEEREIHLGNIEVIPSPGHTAGSTSFFVHSPHGNYLFTGDTLTLSQNRTWEAGFIPGHSDREVLIESLELLRELDPDMVICSGFDGGNPYEEISSDCWASRVDRALEGLV
ncbi:MBL fold metallo-hydrolase [Microbulbifer halophilus]|uniref:MBL fold metallo-hydrolase n=1 Tax=Microbulbifer halophilus TaxID=453963 RepID=A0ABW5E7Y4_9GAMM|nr:MBL fold metallo-hydrolase [Microbulbifer halophilus]MCW8125932.1 MBL fold metallo-hydrolase [Microbulbifer halophilus]